MSDNVNGERFIEALQHTGDPDDLHYIYKWVEENTEGVFDCMEVIRDEVSKPRSGVSIDPRDGRMVLATRTGLRHISEGDYVMRNSKGKFTRLPAKEFESMFEEIFDEE